MKISYEELFPRLTASLPKSPKALEYCRTRGLDYTTLEIGYNSGKLHDKLRSCIIFPLKDRRGIIVSLYGRRTGDGKGHTLEFGKHFYSENRCGLYPGYPDAATRYLIITEAVIDAATLLQIPQVTGSYTILSAYGTNGLTNSHKAAIRELKNLEEIIFFFDGDRAGRQAAEKYRQELTKTLPHIRLSAITTPEDEDVNSLFVKHGKDKITELISERKPATDPEPAGHEFFSLTENHSDEKKNTPAATKDAAADKILTNQPAGATGANASNPVPDLDTSQPHKIIYETDTARYIVKGSLPGQLEKMTVSLDVQHLETGLKYRCRLDLYEEKQTRKEAREAGEKLGLRLDLIEYDLSKLTDLLDEYRENLFTAEPEENNKKEKPVTPYWQQRCLKILRSAHLMDELRDMIKQAGVTGEEKNITMLFLCAFSHKMPETLHVIIQGSSGSGKTTLLSKTAGFMPPERVIRFTRVTEGSFYNYQEYFFVGMYVCFEDLDGLKQEALLAVRELISNEILVSSTSEKNENGNIRAKPKTVRGPMASVSATTNGEIYEDNESRVFVIAVDESRQQTERIVSYHQRKAASLVDESAEKEATELLQNLVRMLRPYKVHNPYANKVSLPHNTRKLRRLSNQFLALVKQVTLLHQYQRKKTGEGRLISIKADVRIAIETLFDTIVLKTDELDGGLRQFFERLKAWVKAQGGNPEHFEFMRRDVRQALHVSNTQLHRFMEKLTDLEYVSQTGGYNNRGLKYKILWWDDYAAFRDRIKRYLLDQLKDLPDEIV